MTRHLLKVVGRTLVVCLCLVAFASAGCKKEEEGPKIPKAPDAPAVPDVPDAPKAPDTE